MERTGRVAAQRPAGKRCEILVSAKRFACAGAAALRVSFRSSSGAASSAPNRNWPSIIGDSMTMPSMTGATVKLFQLSGTTTLQPLRSAASVAAVFSL